MVKRRLQFTGGTSYTVTLPKEWVLSNDLKRNDVVAITPSEDGALVIRPGEDAPIMMLGRKSLKVDGLTTDAVERRLIGAYMTGYSEIEVVSKDVLSEEVVALTTEFAHTSVGVEVVESDGQHIVLRDFMDSSEINPLQNLQRMKIAVRNILSDIINSMELGSHMGALQNRDSEVDRIRLLVMRQINILSRNPSHANGISIGDLGAFGYLAGLMGDVGDACVSMNDVLMRFENRGAIEELALILEQLNTVSLFVNSVDSVLQKDMYAGDSCIDACDSAESRLKGMRVLFSRFDGDDALEINTLAIAISEVFDSIMSISEWAVYSSMS